MGMSSRGRSWSWSGGEALRVGDRVVGEPHAGVRACYLCRTGNVQICPTKRSPGWGIDGAFTSFLKMPELLLHRVPDEMSYEVAAVVEPTANTVHDVIERAKVEAGDFVVVLGPGPIGLLAGLTARAGGARHVVIIGAPSDEAVRLKKARELGFDTVINLAETNPVEVVQDLTNGIGADLVIDCSGAPPAIASTVDLVRKKGRIGAIGPRGGEHLPSHGTSGIKVWISRSACHELYELGRTIKPHTQGRSRRARWFRIPWQWEQAFERWRPSGLSGPVDPGTEAGRQGNRKARAASAAPPP